MISGSFGIYSCLLNGKKPKTPLKFKMWYAASPVAQQPLMLIANVFDLIEKQFPFSH